jgi:hypothetical protein
MPVTSPPPSIARLPRLRRVEAPKPFQLPARDVAIVHAVARFRFLSSVQIARCVGGSHQQILRRLRLLFDHAYLDRPAAQLLQLTHVLETGNQPLIYGLGRAGARLMADHGDTQADKLDWTTKNTPATALFLAHTIETADAMIAFDSACKMNADVALIDHHALIPFMPEATRKARDPFRCRVSISLPHQREALMLSVIPDRLFSLRFANDTRFNFALELDRGTMDIASRTLVGKSSIRRKLIGYHQAWLQKRHTERWGFQSFRVLMLTPSEKRLQNMLAEQQTVVGGKGSNLFLFSTPDRVASLGALGPAWVSGKGAAVVLAP